MTSPPSSPTSAPAGRRMSGPTSDHVTPHQQLLDKIRVRSATVGVIGLGYVGLPRPGDPRSGSRYPSHRMTTFENKRVLTGWAPFKAK